MTFFSRRAQYITYAAISQKEEDMRKTFIFITAIYIEREEEEDMRKDIYICYCNLHRKEGRGGSNINAISHADITHAAINQKKEEDMIGKGFI